jgi:hypothetical protein
MSFDRTPHRRTPVARARLLVVVTAALALFGISGCEAGNPLDPPAARVGDTVIDDKTLQADIDAAGERPAAADGSTLQVAGQSEGTYRGDVAAFTLADRVRAALVERLIDRENIEVTEEQRTSAREQLCGGVDEQTGQPADCSSFEAFPQAYQDFQLELVSQQLALAQEFGPELQAGLQEDYDQLVEDGEPSLQQSCFDVNAFQTEEEAVAAGQITGTAFEELSQQYQALGCIPFERRNELPPELSNIEDGAVSGVLPDPSGAFLLARRTDSTQSFEDYARTQIEGGAELTDQILKAQLGKVAVEVDPRYGRWDAKAFRVVANERPKGVEAPQPPDTAAGEGAGAESSGQ